jgi:hypothetical protein
MQRIVAFILLLTLSTYFQSCRSRAADNSVPNADSMATKPAAAIISAHNPEFRAAVKKGAVAEYKGKTDDKLNDFYFAVRLFETRQTDNYLIKMEFEGIEGEDTLKLPDLGTPPRPVLQKGKDKYSCIIGFMDNDNQFREYKKVFVTENGKNLRITALKHYAVTEGFKLESE